MKKSSLLILFIFNCILLIVGWIMSIYAFTHLPEYIPLFLNLFKVQTLWTQKSNLFFIIPAVQTLYFILFMIVSKIIPSNIKTASKARAAKELLLLSLIFFNLIFIHIQKSFIFIAHRIENRANHTYIYTLFGIVLMLIPYYRLRTKVFTGEDGKKQEKK